MFRDGTSKASSRHGFAFRIVSVRSNLSPRTRVSWREMVSGRASRVRRLACDVKPPLPVRGACPVDLLFETARFLRLLLARDLQRSSQFRVNPEPVEQVTGQCPPVPGASGPAALPAVWCPERLNALVAAG